MANSAEFDVVINAVGNLEKALKNLRNVGSETEKVTKKTRDASKAQDELNYKLNQGTTGVSSAARSFSKLTQAIGSGPNGLVGAYATLAANAFAVSAAFNLLRGAAQAEQVMKGLEVQGARTGQALTVTAKKVQELSGYTLSLADSMQATAQASAAGFDTKSIERLTKAATDSSAALGRNMPDSMDRLVKGLTKMEPELLDELGAMTKLTEASKIYAMQNGKTEASLSTLEKRTAFSNAILSELELKFGGVADEANATARSYDRLSAAFTDLTNKGLNMVSALLAPLVEFLAKNKLALFALGVAFVSSIRGQIIPGITELAKVQAKAAEEQSKRSQKEIESLNKLGSGKRKAYNELVESIKAGTQTEEQYTRASEELAVRKQATLDKVYKNQATGEKLRMNQLAKIAKEEEALTAAQTAGAKARREQAIASGISATEDMNMFNALGKLGGALSETKEALRANATAKKLSGEAAGGLSGKMKLLGSQAMITGKIMGTAFLNFLPVIGQIMFAISLLVEVFNALKSAETKALESAVSNLEEVVKNANNTVKELARVEDSTASLSARTEKTLIARSQAVSNLATAYKEVVKAAKDAQNAEEGASTGVAGFWESLTSDKGNRSWFLGIRQDSKVLTAALEKDSEEQKKFLGANVSWARSTQQELNTQSVKTLDALSNLVPEETFNRVIELHGGLKTVIGSTELTGKVIEELSKREGQTAQVTKDLTQSFKSADDALTEFLKSAAITTPYDKVVKSFESVTKALVDMTLAVPDSTQWSGLLTGLGPEMEKMLDSQNRQVIQQARMADATIQGLKSQKDLTGSLTLEQEKLLKTEQEKLVKLDKQLPSIIANIEQEKERFVLAQAQTREMQAQIGVIQAIMSKNQLAYTAGAAGEMARLNREEQVREIQISSLEVQKQILESSLEQTKATLNQLEAQRKLNKEINLQASATAVNTARAQLDAALTEARALKIPEQFITTSIVGGREMFPAASGLTPEQLDARNRVVQATQVLNSKKSELEIDRQIVAARSEERDITSTINSLESRIQELRVQNLTAGQKAAKAAEAEQQSKNEILALETAKQNQERTNIALTNKRLRLERGINSAIADQVESIGVEYSNQLNSFNTQVEAQTSSLSRSLDTVREMKKTASGDELAAYNSLEAKLTEQLKLQTEIAALKRQELAAQRDINILEAAGVKSREEQLSALKNTVELYQKRADLAKAVADQEMEIAKNAAEINILRAGGEVDERTSKQLDVEAARVALQSAEAQYELKMAAIEVEYKLLEAQQKTQKTNLEVQLAVLAAYYKMINGGKDLTQDQSDIINTLSAAVSNIENIDFSAMRELEERQAQNTVTLAQQALKKAELTYANLDKITREPEFANLGERIASRSRDRARAEEEATRAPNQLPELGNRPISVVLDQTAKTAAETAVKAMQEQTPKPSSGTAKPVTAEDMVSILLRGVEDLTNKQFGITSGFGYRTHPVTGQRKFHPAVDYATPMGTPIYAPFSGSISRASFDPLSGNTIKVKDSFEQVEIAALHLSKILVREGQQVEKGDLLGYTGGRGPGAGRSTGAHLDYRIRDLTTGKYINPEEGITINVKTPEIVVTGRKEGTGVAGAAEDVSGSVTEQAQEGIGALDSGTKSAKITMVDLFDTIRAGIERSKRLFTELSTEVTEKLGADFGPEGRILTSLMGVIDTISVKIPESLAVVGTSFDEWKNKQSEALKNLDKDTQQSIYQAERLASAFSAASQIVSSIASLLKSISDAKIAAVDKEIAAEQKRDGKSAESVSKLESLEKKKDSMARKAFNTQKKLMLAQAVMSTAAAVAGTYAALAPIPVVGPTLAAVAAGVIGALGLAQVAIISGMQYESSYSPKAAATPSTLSIGKRDSSVDLAKGPNANAGGEVSYLRGAEGTGTNASNYRTVGSAYGGDMTRGYGNRGFVVGEKGPELITPETPITVTPANDIQGGNPINANISIHAIDSQGVQDVLVSQKGNIIKMLREAANASGQRFMENVNVNVYTRPNVGKL